MNLKTNGIASPLGFELGSPSLSWTVEDTSARRQLSARVEIEREGEPLYDSGERADISSLGFRPGIELSPRTRYAWRVSVTGDNGERGVSGWSFFETALGDGEWSAEWICPDTDDVLPVMYGTLTLDGEPERARIYASGLGLYRLTVNGAPASDELFAPGLNAYDSWVQYQTYDVTRLLKKGENLIEISLSGGIAKGRFARAKADEYNYCPVYTCICQTHVRLKNGGERVFRSGADWRWRPSALKESSIYDGEVYDANAPVGEPRPVRIYVPPVGPLRARLSPPVKIKQRLAPKAIITTPAGETVLDMGQNMTGWVSFRAKAPKGRRLSLYYGEILQDGCFYRDNLRSAKAEYHYISDGNEAVVEPAFTYYGFRYVKLEGFDGPRREDFTGCVIYSDLERTGYIKTSDERINRLFENALWSQKSNFLDVPTDCPQRDERLGWTGDAQVFSGTACFNMDCRAFFTKYLADMWYEQRRNGGRVPHVVPDVKGRRSPAEGGAVAWADAAVTIPWNVYLHYGDVSILERQADSMAAWVDWVSAQKDWAGDTMHFGDWVALDNPRRPQARVGATDIGYLCAAYHYYTARITSSAMEKSGRRADAEKYALVAEKTLEELRREYFTPTGRLAVNTQTALVLALYMGLTPEPRKTLGELKERLWRDGDHLTTGFIGTPWLCMVLPPEQAYGLLLLEDYPSWLYQVKMGATTMWERWNSVMPDGHITPTQMNSLNHYAYGSIVEWMYRRMCGINPVEDAPGFARAIIAPQPDPTGTVKWAECELDTAAGKYRSAWRSEGERTVFELRIPFNCEAELRLPDGRVERLEAGEYKFEAAAPECDKREVIRNHGLL